MSLPVYNDSDCCPRCNAEAVSMNLGTTNNDTNTSRSKVLWCASGHVIVIDVGSYPQTVYTFARKEQTEDLIEQACKKRL